MINASAAAARKTILIVDDDEGILDALAAMLETRGFDTLLSSDGEILEQLNKTNLPHVILLDVLLSGKDGRDICIDLKKKKLTKDIPVIMFSAEPTAAKGSKVCGADAFIAKPFEVKDLMEKIDKFSKVQ